MFKAAVVGSPDYHDYAAFSSYIDLKLSRVSQTDTIEIVTSHSKSTTEMAVKYAGERGYTLKHIELDHSAGDEGWERLHDELLGYCDCLIAFWDGSNGAVKHLLEKAQKTKIKLAVKQITVSENERTEKPWPENLFADTQVLVSMPVQEERIETALQYIKLNERVKQAVYYRYKDGLTLQAAGEQMGISRERVRQLCDKGIRIIYSRRSDVASIVETGILQKLKANVPLVSTSLRKKYRDELAGLGIHTVGELRETPDYQKFSAGEPIMVTKE